MITFFVVTAITGLTILFIGKSLTKKERPDYEKDLKLISRAFLSEIGNMDGKRIDEGPLGMDALFEMYRQKKSLPLIG